MSAPDPAARDAFFVGYLPMPRRLGRWLAILVPLVVGGAGGLAIAFALAQGDPGDGGFRWDLGTQTLTGRLRATPYPVLFTVPEAGHPDGRAVLLSGIGKVGVAEMAAPLDGRMVDVSGIYIRRGPTDMLQVGGPTPMRETEAALAGAERDYAPGPPASLGRRTLRGEIVDTKCYLGAMRPGQGKVHKACAGLCLMGGIPPVFVVYHGDGATDLLLMTGPDGGPVPAAVLDNVGLYVSASGEVERQGDLLLFRVDPASVAVL